MTVENKFARFMRNTGPARFFIPLGIILIVFGIIMLGYNTENFKETTGKIVAIEQSPYVEGEAQQYDLTISFKAYGKDYETLFANLSGDYKEGDEITVYYDPADPQRTTNTKSGFIAPIMIGVGALALVFGTVSTVKAFKKSRALDEAVVRFPSEAFEGFKDLPGVTEYYFRYDGNVLKPGYIVEDAKRNVLYEGKMTKQAVVGAREYEFHNHMTGKIETHEVGHTVTQSYNDEFFSAKSWFRFDSMNVWDVIHARGVRISTNLHSKFPYCIYDIAKDGEAFARVETSGVHVHEDEAAEHKLNMPTGGMYYRIWTSCADLDTLFLTVFAISESEQSIVE